MTRGMMVDGSVVWVDGVDILAPGGEPWNRLVRYAKRAAVMGIGYRPQMGIIHKTSADHQERILDNIPTAELGAWGRARYTVEYWANHVDEETGKPEPYSGTHLVTGHGGATVCTADLVRIIGWHAGARDGDANNRSYGHEIKEHADGRVYRATLEATVKVELAACNALGIQWQCPRRPFIKPLARFDDGGRTLFGLFGHCDVTTSRNRHDPGDEVFAMLEVAGFERFDFAAREDIDAWSKRQEWLKCEGYYSGLIDGLPGARTTAALARLGYPAGIYARRRELAESPPGP